MSESSICSIQNFVRQLGEMTNNYGQETQQYSMIKISWLDLREIQWTFATKFAWWMSGFKLKTLFEHAYFHTGPRRNQERKRRRPYTECVHHARIKEQSKIFIQPSGLRHSKHTNSELSGETLRYRQISRVICAISFDISWEHGGNFSSCNSRNY